AFFNQMLFVMARTAMLDIFALTFGLFGIAAFLFGFRKQRPHIAFALAGLAFGLSTACKWSGLFPLATCIVGDPADAGLAHELRRWPGIRLVSPRPLARLQGPSFRDRLRHAARGRLLFELHCALWALAVGSDRGAATHFRRQQYDRAWRTHLYERVAVLA